MDKTITYAFLSVIKEKSGNIKSLLSIFEELTEALIACRFKKGITSGLLFDLKKDYLESYSIEIPIPTLRTMLTNISHKYSDSFTIYSDDAFIINSFPNIDLGDIIDTQKREVDDLYELYDLYLEKNNINKEENTLLDYIEQNKRHIIKYLAGESNFDCNCFAQAKFLKELIDLKIYDSLIERIFLGSIISSYIEIEIDDSMKNRKTLLLDTNFIVSLLDLHSKESNDNCKMLMKIASDLKYKVEVMPFTVDETSALLNRIADRLTKITYFQSLDKDSIYYGCFRNNINSSSLSFIAKKFMERLQKEYGVIITDDKTNQAIINEAKVSKIYTRLRYRTHNPDGALHDATVLYYTQKLRKKTPSSFKDIDVWFVTDSKGFSENLNILDGNVPLMIRAEELLNILWISHPVFNEFSKYSLAKTISGTLNACLPDKRMLRAMDKKVQVIKDYPINTRDCIKIAEVIASIDNQKLSILVEKNKQEDIIAELHRLSEFAETIEEKEKIKKYEFMDMIMEKMEKSKQRELDIIERAKNQELQTIGIEEQNRNIQTEIKYLEDILERDQEEQELLLAEIGTKIFNCAKKVFRRLMTVFGLICIVGFFLIAGIIYKNWSIAEPVIYLFTFVPFILSYFVGVLTSHELSLNKISGSINIMIENHYKKKHLNLLARNESLLTRISESKLRIKEVRARLLYK